MLYGLAKCEPAHATQQRQYITQLQRLFTARVLPIATAFERYGPEKAKLMQQVTQGHLPKYPGEFDVLIGCTALVHNLTLVTRNTRDFTPLIGLALDDWTVASAATPERPRPPRRVIRGRLRARGRGLEALNLSIA